MSEKKDVIVKFIREWAVGYVKHRDILTKNIINIKEEQDKVIVEFKDKEQVFLIRPIINDSVIQEINKDENIGIVTLNSKENLDFLTKNWNKLIKFERLALFFINPFSEPDNKWFISPYVHDRICDNDSLKLGLKTMFETVETITEKEILEKI